jgi:hypothetical protein
MSRITGRLRAQLAAVPRRVMLSPAVAAVGIVAALAAGRQAKAWDIAAAVGGSLLVSAVGGVLRARARPSGSAPAGLDAVSAYEAAPVPDAEVLILVNQGRKIHAIKRYRQLNPGIGLKQAKDVIDGL